MDAEDFLVLTKTYPEHPLSKVDVKASTLREMKQQRRDHTLNEVNKFNEKVQKRMDELEVTRPTYVKGEFTVDNPVQTSINQKHSLEKIQKRR